MLHEIQAFTKTKKMSLKPQQAPAHQWERILKISGISPFFNRERIRKHVIEIVEKNNGKILAPKFDVWMKQEDCFVLVEGWDSNELAEEEIMEKMEKEEGVERTGREKRND